MTPISVYAQPGGTGQLVTDDRRPASVSVVIVSYNTVELLEHCVRTVEDQLPAGSELVVVDNASWDGSAAMVRERFPAVRLIVNEANVGFATACNQGIRDTTGRYILLVNPDCELQPGSVEGLIDFMDAHPRAAVAGGRLRYADGGFQHSSFRFPSLAQVALDLFPLHWRLLESPINGRYPRDWDEAAFEIDHPLGALMCVRRAAVNEIGLFDQAFFMYAEEVDWCYRFKQAGWQVWHCPAALAIHHGGRSTRQRASAMFIQLQRSRFHFYRKHYSVWFRLAARAIVAAGMIKLALGDVLAQVRAGRTIPERRQHALACLKVLRL